MVSQGAFPFGGFRKLLLFPLVSGDPLSSPPISPDLVIPVSLPAFDLLIEANSIAALGCARRAVQFSSNLDPCLESPLRVMIVSLSLLHTSTADSVQPPSFVLISLYPNLRFFS